MKKLVAIMLALALLCCLVSVSAGAEGKIKLTGMCWGSTAQYDEQIAQLFEAYPELGEKYEVEWVLGGSSSADVAEKIRLGMSANEAVCDLAVLNYIQMPEFSRAGVLYDLTEAIAPYSDTMTNSGRVLSQCNGQTVAVPYEVKTKVWYYRSDIFEECGINVEDIKNTDDFIAAGKKIQETYPDSYMWNFGSTPASYQYYLTLSGNGACFYDENGEYNIASDPGVRAMLEDYKKMIDAGIIANISDWTSDWEAALADGTIVTQPCAGWLGQNIFLPTYSGEGNKWKVTTWPVIGGTDCGSDAGGSLMVVPKFSAHPDEAAELIAKLCLSEEGTKVVFRANGSLPQNTTTLADQSLFAEQENGYFGMSIVEAQIAAMDKYAIFTYSPNASAEMAIANEYFKKAIYGEMSIDDALHAAEEDMRTMIGNAFD